MGDDSTWLLLMRLAVGAAVVYLTIRWLLVPRADFTIRLRRGRVEFRGAFPLAQRAALTELLHDLGLEGPAKIMGVRRGARLRVWFGGALTDGQKQRIRNFLLSHH